jgi:transcriptional regulator with XRE-family HTH domain
MSSRDAEAASNAKQIREFLTSRRARMSPERAGLATYGRRRRVSGLRREEVALLANISVEYYTRLERGNARGASQGVLDGIARALQLDEAERAHLLDLVRAANAVSPAGRDPAQPEVREAVRLIVDSITGMPAMVRNRRLDILYANRLGYAFYSDVYRDPVRPANPARFVFLDPRSSEFFIDWEAAAHDMVALLRAEAGRNPSDRALSDMVDELSARNAAFRVRWAAHNVLFHRSGVRGFHHPIVGDLTLAYEDLELPADPGQTVLVFTAEPNSPSRDALDRLASWASTHDPLSVV